MSMPWLSLAWFVLGNPQLRITCQVSQINGSVVQGISYFHVWTETFAPNFNHLCTTCGNNRLCLDSPSVSLRVSLGWQLPQLLQLQEHLWFSDPAVALTSLPADSLLMTINLFGFGFDSCIPWPTILFALHYACPNTKMLHATEKFSMNFGQHGQMFEALLCPVIWI